ncbi:MAG: hypothetical protein WDO24_21090, partial [Pseudomonadota bacterium]
MRMGQVVSRARDWHDGSGKRGPRQIMSIYDTDRTLASNRMIFEIRRDMAKYRRFRQDLETCMADTA